AHPADTKATLDPIPGEIHALGDLHRHRPPTTASAPGPFRRRVLVIGTRACDQLRRPTTNSPGNIAARTDGEGSETELAQLFRVPLPVLGHLHVQVQVDAGAEDVLDLLAG